jgi:iron complex outermembrane receptor protein
MNTLLFRIWLLLMFLLIGTYAHSQFITGKVVDADNNLPLPSATVHVNNTYIVTVTNVQGYFAIKQKIDLPASFTVSYLGYESVTVQIDSNISEITVELNRQVFLNAEVAVSATKANTDMAMAFTNLNKDEISKQNFSQDIPYILQLQPSTVATSDAGTGIGYTGIRIRGTDASRINVMINGIPLNDAESQQLYWVNVPDIASSADQIQIQRGVGTSTNGGNAFGASINITSGKPQLTPHAQVGIGMGTFGTLQRNLKLSSGLLSKHFVVDGRFSHITSNGYVDRANADLMSFIISGTYLGDKSSLRFNLITGIEKTYQAWNGVPQARMDNDIQGMLAYIDRNYLDNAQAQNLLQSGRTYNSFTYDNQTDNYKQKHLQLFYSTQLNHLLDLHVAMHYTLGKGYYEEYKQQQDLAQYQMQLPVVGNDTISNSDLIRRKWLDNDFYGANFSMNYNLKKLKLIWGGALNQYQGKHFGRVIWAQFAGNNPIDFEYYFNDATKTDLNLYAKATYNFTEKLIGFADMQFRTVAYEFQGIDQNFNAVIQQETLHFFNPKMGITFKPASNQTLYTSFSVANHEPSRDDYINSTIASRPKHESLYDLEGGYRYAGRNFNAGLNYYLMLYKNQLVLTGKVNDVGEYTRTNMKNSLRQGVELDAAYRFYKWLEMKGNLTLSSSKIKSFTEYLDNYDLGNQQKFNYQNTNIAFSPTVISNFIFEFNFTKRVSLQLIGQYVGKQYLDNTQNQNKMLPAYGLMHLRAFYTQPPTKYTPAFDLSFQINNLLNKKYSANGYTYSYISGGNTIAENFYYPQAGTQLMLQLKVSF